MKHNVRPLDVILKHGFLLIDNAVVKASNGELPNSPMDDFESEHQADAVDMVLELAYKNGTGETAFPLDRFLNVYPEYKEIATSRYRDGLYDTNDYQEY